MADVEGVLKVQAALKAAESKYGKTDVSVVVGYTQSYAVYVHENLEAFHPVGQAKFLEQPHRTMQRELAEMISNLLNSGVSLVQTLFLAGLRLQRESQKLCPVDTGALKASAFTKIEKE